MNALGMMKTKACVNVFRTHNGTVRTAFETCGKSENVGECTRCGENCTRNLRGEGEVSENAHAVVRTALETCVRMARMSMNAYTAAMMRVKCPCCNEECVYPDGECMYMQLWGG